MVDTVEARGPQGSDSIPDSRPGTQIDAPKVRKPAPAVLPRAIRALTRLVWAVVLILDAAVLLDFVFRLIGAKDDGFAHAVFAFGSTLASPFDSIFASVGSLGGYAFRWSDLVVVALFTVAGFVVTRILRVAQPRKRVMA
jgi:hypothetical protein